MARGWRTGDDVMGWLHLEIEFLFAIAFIWAIVVIIVTVCDEA